MSSFLLTLTILLGSTHASAQDNGTKLNTFIDHEHAEFKRYSAPAYTEVSGLSDVETRPIVSGAGPDNEPANEKVGDGLISADHERQVEDSDTWKRGIEGVADREKLTQTKNEERFHWKPALIQSGILLGIQHGFRLTQKKTKRELGGPFFADWRQSVQNLRGWKDEDGFFINYIAHSLQGGVTGRIFINNSDKAKKQEFGKSKKYWESRFKALAWSAVWSTQFELGPVSEASIGNVGLYDNYGPSKMAWGDLVVTPVIGTGVVIGEDVIDKYMLKNWLERKANYKVTTKIKILRSFLTPTTSFTNLLRGKMPWKRDNRR